MLHICTCIGHSFSIKGGDVKFPFTDHLYKQKCELFSRKMITLVETHRVSGLGISMGKISAMGLTSSKLQAGEDNADTVTFLFSLLAVGGEPFQSPWGVHK